MSNRHNDSPGRRLRAAWAAETVAVPGAFCPLVAKLAERMGFRAFYLSGAALSAGLGLEEAVRRARLYLEAGADAVFPEALESEEEFAAFARALPGVPLVANMTEFGRSPSLDVPTLARLGYRLVLFPVTALRSALG